MNYNDNANYEYYYGKEAEQFLFYRIPKALFTEDEFKELSIDSKVLYGFLLDRMSLSMNNGWFDNENKVYVIYTIENIMQDLGCGRDKAVKILAELDTKKGIGLIERKKQGFGKPDIIYVKKFARKQVKVCGKSYPHTYPHQIGKTDFTQSENPTSCGRKNRLYMVGKTDPNNTNINNTNNSYINHINQEILQNKNDRMDVIDMMNANTYISYIKSNVDYDDHMKIYNWQDKELYDELVNTICDIVCVSRRSVKIGKEDYPYELVKSKFLKLNASHLEYVMECMKNTTTKIANIKAYMITALYNAPNTMNHYYQQEVQHDMYGC